MGYIGKNDMGYEWLRGVWRKIFYEERCIPFAARARMIKEYSVEPPRTLTGNHYSHHFKVVNKPKFIHKMFEEMGT